MGKSPGPGGGEAQHLEAVRQRTGMSALAAIFDIVVDRMIVGGNGLECGEIRLGHGPARNIEALADREILEEAAFRKTVLPAVELVAGGHGIAAPPILYQENAALIASRPCGRRRRHAAEGAEKALTLPGTGPISPPPRGNGILVRGFGIVDWHCWEVGRDARAAARWCRCARGQVRLFERLAALSNEWPRGSRGLGGWLRMNMRV